MFSQLQTVSQNTQSGLPFGLNARDQKRTVPLQEIQMNCLIQDSFIKLQIRQIYKNTFANPIEVQYVFPVCNDASVASLQVQTEKGLIDAVIEEKEEAKNKYEDTISQGNTAFMASYDTDDSQDRMILNIGNLQPDSQATVIITYIGICAIEAQNQVLLIPCAFTPKYDMKKAGQVNQSTQVEMVNKVTYKINVECDIQSKQKQIISADSLHHKINTQQKSPYHWKITLDPQQMYEPDQDFVLKFQTKDQFVPRYLLHKSKDNQIAGFISFIPQLSQTSDGTGEFIFVLDRSGSMSGTRIEMAKQAAILFLKSLPEGCKFNIVSFGSDLNLMFSQSTLYNEQSLNQAVQQLSSFKADMGATEILEPLNKIFQQPSDPNLPRTIFLLTDGDVSNPQQVVSKIEQHREECRLHSFGIGEGVSTQLINESAQAGRGKAYFIKDGENIQLKVIESLKKAAQPALTFENIDWGGLKAERVPQKGTYFYNDELTYLFFFLDENQQKQAKIKINCKNTQINAQKYTHCVNIDLNNSQQEDTLHKLIAKYKIRELEKNTQKNKQQIISLSLKYQVLSTLTSFIGKLSNPNPTQGEMQFIRVPIQTPKDYQQYFQRNFYSSSNYDLEIDMKGMPGGMP